MDIFISYSRRDKAAAQEMHQALEADGITAWVDWEGIPPTTDWMAEIYAGIEAANAFLFFISPDSLNSEYCQKELEHALKHNKKIIPVLHREPDGAPVPPALANHNWIYARTSDDLPAAFATIGEAVHTDYDWVAAHTRLLTRAIEWESNNKSRSFTLSGEDLNSAEEWLSAASDGRQPQPTQLQNEYILASRQRAITILRQIIAGVGVALIVAVLLAIIAFGQYTLANTNLAQAQTQEAIALTEEAHAIAQQQTAQAEANARATQQALAENAATQEAVALRMALTQQAIAVAQQETAVAEANARATQESIALTEQANAIAQQQTAEAEANARATQQSIAQTQEAIAISEADQRATAQANAEVQKATAVAAQATAEYNASVALVRYLAAQANSLAYEKPQLANLLSLYSIQESEQNLGTILPEALNTLFNLVGQNQTFSVAHTSIIELVTFSYDGKYFATADHEYAVTIWDAATAQPIRSYQSKGSWTASTITFVPNDSSVIIIQEGCDIYFWDWKNDVILNENRFIYTCHFGISPENSYFVSGILNSSKVELYEWAYDPITQNFSFKKRDALTATASTWPTSFVFSTNDQFLAALVGNSVDIWDLVNGTHKNIPLPRTDLGYTSIQFSPFDNHRYLIVGGPNTIGTLDRLSNYFLPAYEKLMAAQTITFANITNDPNDVRVVGCGNGDTAYVRTLYFSYDYKQQLPHEQDIINCAGNPNKPQVITITTNILRFWDLDANQIHTLADYYGGTSEYYSDLVFHPDEQNIAVIFNFLGDNYHGVSIRNWRNPTYMPGFSDQGSSSSELAFNPLNPQELLLRTDHVTLWQWQTAQNIGSLSTDGGAVTTSISTAPDSNLASISDSNGKIYLYKLDTRNLLKKWAVGGTISNTAIYPPNKVIAVSKGKNIEVWDWGSNPPNKKYSFTNKHTGAITSLAISHDGNFLAAGSADNTITIWDLLTGQYKITLSGHTDAVTDVKFYPTNNKVLATSAEDGRAILWGWESNLMIHTYRLEDPHLATALDFSKSGDYLAVTRKTVNSTDPKVHIYLTDIHQLIARMKERLFQPNLTTEECQLYLGRTDCQLTIVQNSAPIPAAQTLTPLAAAASTLLTLWIIGIAKVNTPRRKR